MYCNSNYKKQNFVELFLIIRMLFSINTCQFMKMRYNFVNKIDTQCTTENTYNRYN